MREIFAGRFRGRSNKKSARSRASVLTDQKISKKQPNSKIRPRSIALIASALLLVAATGAIWFSYQPTSKDRNAANVDWNFTIRIENDQKDTDRNFLATVNEILSQHVKTGSPAELRRCSSLLMRMGSFSNVNIVKTTRSNATVTLQLREPVMVLEAGDKKFFATSDGGVYEDLKRHPNSIISDRPIIQGVFSHRNSGFAWDQYHLLILSPEERKSVREAVKLLEALEASHIDVLSIQHLRFRGFLIVLKDQQTEVTVGYGPFKEKLVKLKEITQQMQKNGTKAARIELDYDGKAFVKERKG